MKTKLFFFMFTMLASAAYSQVGVNTVSPKATLQVDATNGDDATIAEGIIAPKLTRMQLAGKDAKYDADQTGAIVYVSDTTGTSTTKTLKVTAIGYYHFDGTLWQPFRSPWYKSRTEESANLVTDTIYHAGIVSVGGPTRYHVNGAPSPFNVIGGDAFINGITVGTGRKGYHSNVAIGGNALAGNETGFENTAVGSRALYLNKTGVANTAIGVRALTNSISGSSNVAVGIVTLDSLTTGGYNTAIGSTAGAKLKSGSFNILIGNAQAPDSIGSDQLNIGNAIYGTLNAATSTSRQSGTHTNGRISIGKTAPAAGVVLDVAATDVASVALQVTGSNSLKYVDGNQGAGKVLISDANGIAKWSTLSTLRASQVSSPIVPSMAGTAYKGQILAGINSGISISIPANSTYAVLSTQCVVPIRELYSYLSSGNILTESAFLSFTWSDTPTGGSSADITYGQLFGGSIQMSRYTSISGTTVIRNTSSVTKTYYLTTASDCQVRIQNQPFTVELFNNSTIESINSLVLMPINN